MGTKERLAWQRMQLNKKLGLDVAAQLGFDSSTIFSNEDIEPGGEMEKEEEVSRILLLSRMMLISIVLM